MSVQAVDGSYGGTQTTQLQNQDAAGSREGMDGYGSIREQQTDTTPDANGVGNDGRVAVITITKQPAGQA